MNLPNRLTVSRLILTLLFVAVAESGWPWAFSLAAVLFGVASYTDYLDGRIARDRGLITPFGQLMDPLADKVLMAAAFVVLVEQDLMPGWLVIAVLAREFLVTGLRLVASSKGAILAADKWGKQKTVWQIVAAIYFLVYLATRETPFAWLRFLYELPLVQFDLMRPLLLFLTLATTLWSGWVYFWKNRRLVLSEM